MVQQTKCTDLFYSFVALKININSVCRSEAHILPRRMQKVVTLESLYLVRIYDNKTPHGEKSK